MQETSLHASLKEFYSLDVGNLETTIDGYIIDVVRPGLLIEVQTHKFYAIKTKISSLLANHPVRVVHPIACEKWIVKLPELGQIPVSRRKSPRRGRLEHIFLELVYIPHLLTHLNFSLEVLLINEEEIRRADRLGSWRRNGVSIIDHRLLDVTERYLFESRDAYRCFIPQGIEQPFSSRDLSKILGIKESLARKMTYCLRSIGILRISGKKGNTMLYKINHT